MIRGFASVSKGYIPAELPVIANSIAGAMTIPPIHVDHVAEAICIALDPARDDVRGVVDVKRIKGLIGWTDTVRHGATGGI
jgi:hypothetical protein